MKRDDKSGLDRRRLFGTLGLGAIGGVLAPYAKEARADTENDADKRKARYRADSAEVQTFYRVNRYPPSRTRGQ